MHFVRLGIPVSALLASLALVAAWARPMHAQSSTPLVGTDTVTVSAFPAYKSSSIHRLFFGKRYRDLWATPIRVPVLDLARFDGGVKATETGGGQQTKSLRLENAEGREWVFRSVAKDARAVLPEPLRESIAANVVNDQLSHTHPAGALVVPPLAEALGVLHMQPQLAVMPDDPALGEFREVYAGMLGLLEEFPDDGPDGTAGFAGSTKIVNSIDLMEELRDDPSVRVDSDAFLTARLLDLLINDWDRHKDQWKWARLERDGEERWVPIPRDRDQALIWFDGMLPTLARFGAPRLVAFSPRIAVSGLSVNSWEVDRAFLNGIERSVWDSTARWVRSRLTDDVIAEAERRLPEPYRAAYPGVFGATLKARRDDLGRAATQLYERLATVVDIHGSDKREVALIDRLPEGAVEVRLYDGRREKGDPDASGEPYFRRRFLPHETEELRVYLHGGGDSVIVRGAADRSILVRIIGGEGENFAADSSRVAGRARVAALYDFDGKEADVTYGPDTMFDRRPYIVVKGDTVRPPPDRGGTMAPNLRLRYMSDLGLVYGGGINLVRYGFRKYPYDHQISLWLESATVPGDVRGAAAIDFRRERGGIHPMLWFQGSGLEVTRYYGQGNETVRPTTNAGAEFFRAEHTRYRVEALLAAEIGYHGGIEFGPVIQYSRTDRDPSRFVAAAGEYGTGDFGQVGAGVRVGFDTRDNAGAPRRGLRLHVDGNVYPGLWDVDGAFGDVNAEVATYLGFDAPMQPVLALRAGGKKVFGTYPFFESAFLGGFENLRGFDQQRFAGDAAAWGSAELRLRVARVNVLVPGDIGILGLGDVGRVWADGESSDTWHGAFGAGLWFALIDASTTISLSIADGERTGVYVKAGFGF